MSIHNLVETYKGMPIETCLTGYEFPAGLIYQRTGRGLEIGGGGWWSARTLEEARREIDRFLAKAGVDELPPARPWKPAAEAVRLSLSRADLACRVRTSAEAREVAQAVDNPALQAVLGLPLMAWKASTPVAGVIQFVRYDAEGKATDRVLCINAPESRRAEFVPETGDEWTTAVMVG